MTEERYATLMEPTTREAGRVLPPDVDDGASTMHPDGDELTSENLVAEILLNMAPLHLHLHLQRETGARWRPTNSGRLS